MREDANLPIRCQLLRRCSIRVGYASLSAARSAFRLFASALFNRPGPPNLLISLYLVDLQKASDLFSGNNNLRAYIKYRSLDLYCLGADFFQDSYIKEQPLPGEVSRGRARGAAPKIGDGRWRCALGASPR